MKDAKLFLTDIMQAIDAIEGIVHGLDRDQFEQDDKTVGAVMRKLEIIYEQNPKNQANFATMSR